MSCTETHFGKFKILAKGEENIRQYIKDHNIETDGYDDMWPSDTDKYCVTYPYDKNGDKYLLEFIEHKEFYDGDGFEMFHQNKDGTINFGVQFYNGGCGLFEALGGFYKHVNNDN